MVNLLAEIAGLIALGVGSRFVPHLPNMTAIGAIALKSRARFGAAGLLIPLTSMVVSDAIIGFYDWRLLLSVYGSFALIGMLGVSLKRNRSTAVITAVATAGSLLFFLITNVAVWALSTWYPHTLSGLLACYIAGLPFLFTMLAGDLLCAVALFRVERFTHILRHLHTMSVQKRRAATSS